MADNEQKTFMVENARIIFRNFEGKEGPMNVKGDRNFCVVVDEAMAQVLDADGWNVKMTKPREEGDIPVYYVPVKVSYKYRPPRIVMMTTSGRRTNLTEDSVEVLDAADIRQVDLICNGSEWSQPSGKSGVKAYLKTMFVTLEEDALERKYAVNDVGEPSELG